jgi:hypothetical protein
MAASSEEIAWAAGLLEGEGCISHANGRLFVQLKNTDLWVVERFAEIVDVGTVYGPYRADGSKDAHLYRRKPFWVWVGYQEDGEVVIAALWPWLSERRRERAFQLLAAPPGAIRPDDAIPLDRRT